MLPELISPATYLTRMADGTVKQINPFTGTEVWTVPGRGIRPLGGLESPGRPLDPAETDAHCAFCAKRLLDTPPEKARLVRHGAGFATVRDLKAEELFTTEWEFRRIPNLFEIVSYDYWAKNYGYRMPAPLPRAHRVPSQALRPGAGRDRRDDG